MKKINKVIIIILLIGAIVLLGYSSYKLYQSYLEYKEVDDTYNQVIDEYVDTSEASTKKNTKDTFSINWNELLKTNEDIIAWIRIPDTNINYPVVQGENNTEYLHHNIYHKYSKGGSIFVDGYTNEPFYNLNTIIYGHNLDNGSMFSNIKKYKNQQYAEEHRIIYIYLPNGEIRQYKVFAFSEVKADNYDVYNISVDDLQNYYDIIKKYNRLDELDDYDATSSIITLSTCTNRDRSKRYVLQAYLINQ